MRFIVIGITDNPEPFFPPEVLEIIKNGKVFSGGKRHHEIVAPLLPQDAKWIDITAPLDNVFTQYQSQTSNLKPQTIIVFASGDPVYPTFNALQMLAHRLVMPYHDMRIVSLTGRPWHEFDKVLIEGAEKIGVLTDREHTPSAIAQRMLEYGYTYYNMSVGEHLGNPSLENCLIVSKVIISPPKLGGGAEGRGGLNHGFGIPDSAFVLLDGREKMITKMPVRLLTLQALDLPRRHVLWDIGFCTGSVSIEARLQFPHLTVCAFEIRPECEAIIHENARKFGAPGIDIHIGDFLETDITAIPRPDAVFIGGHGGHLQEIMAKVMTVLAPDGVIVFNSVTSPVVSKTTGRPGSRQLWDEACAALHLSQEPPLQIRLNDYNPIEILKAFTELS